MCVRNTYIILCIYIYIRTHIMMYFFLLCGCIMRQFIDRKHICYLLEGHGKIVHNTGKMMCATNAVGSTWLTPPKAMLYCRLFWQTLRFQEMAKRRRVHPEPRLATSGHGRAIDNVSIVVREEKEQHRFIKEQWPKFGLTRSLRPS